MGDILLFSNACATVVNTVVDGENIGVYTREFSILSSVGLKRSLVCCVAFFLALSFARFFPSRPIGPRVEFNSSAMILESPEQLFRVRIINVVLAG